MSKPDIRAVLEHYGLEQQLPEAYSWRPVTCVFHGDRNASASYMSHDDAQAFNCHGCGVSGDSIKIIEMAEGVDYAGALEVAEKITGTKYASGGPKMQRQYHPMRLGDTISGAAPQKPARKKKRRRQLL